MFGWESEAGAEEGALDATFFSFGLPRLSTPLPGPSSSIPASSHPTELEGDCPHTHSHLASLLTKKKKKSHIISSHSGSRNMSQEEKTDGVGLPWGRPRAVLCLQG